MSKAGIIILPDMLHEKQYNNDKSSGGDEESEIVRDVQKWPKKTVLLDTDMFEVDDSWHDTPPEGFSLTVSILEKKRSSNFASFLFSLSMTMNFFTVVWFCNNVGHTFWMDLAVIFGLCVWA